MKKFEEVKSLFAAAAVNEANAKLEALEKANNAENEEEKKEFLKTAKTSQTHERYNEALSSMSDKALALVARYKIDAQALANQSRELKKRSIAILEAIAHSKRCDDRALDAVLQRIAAKHDEKLTIAQIQREMNHSTNTQASYFKTCAVFYKFADYHKADQVVVFDYDNAIIKALLNIYA